MNESLVMIEKYFIYRWFDILVPINMDDVVDVDGDVVDANMDYVVNANMDVADDDGDDGDDGDELFSDNDIPPEDTPDDAVDDDGDELFSDSD